MRMVADKAGVSIATVSNVLNGKTSVAIDIAARVSAAVEQLGYVRDTHAARLRSGKSRLAGVIVPDLTNPMFARFVSTLEHLARLDGYDIVVVSSRNDPAEEAERLSKIREWRPAGLIVIPCDGALADRLPRGLTGPLVVADRIPDDPRFDLIAVNNHQSASGIARHLAEQGYRNLLVVGTSLAISNVAERWHGARDAAGSMRIDLAEVGFADHAPPALAERLSGADRPDALFCLDHETTLAVFQLLARIDLAPGRDIAFASFDDMEWMRLVAPAITAVCQPVEEMAGRAWSMLGRRMEGDASAPEALRLSCSLEIRGSTPRHGLLPDQDDNKSATGGNCS